MTDAIETFADGTAAFVSRLVPAWHGLGTVVSKDMTTAEVMDAAHLAGWDVRLEPVYVQGVAPDAFAVPILAVVRTNPVSKANEVLAAVGSRYKVLQNEELFSFADYITSGGARWETAGSIKSGRTVFGSLAIERETVLDPTGVADKINQYLVIATSHDGTSAVTAANTPVRVVCQNTLNFALKGAKQTFKVRHTQTLDGKLAAARETLSVAERYFDAFDEEAKQLFATPVNAELRDKVIEAVYPLPDADAAKAAKTRYANKRDAIDAILQSPTSDGVQGTAWGILNALTENLDWNRGTRNGKEESKLAAASGFDPVANAERNRIHNVVKATVGL